MPLLLGNGEYINDYVISGVEKNINQTFDDGTIIDAGVTINLLEFVPFSKDEQQAATDRRNAAAVGDKQQIARRPVQPKTSEAEAHTAYGVCGIKVWIFKGEILGHDPMAQDRLMMEAQTSGVRPARDDRGSRN